MDLQQFVEWAFMGIVSAALTWAVAFLGKISKSISDLNNKMAVLIERTAWHQKEIENHEKRLTHLETGKKK